jgi:superfamily I DNA/RNA helicase
MHLDPDQLRAAHADATRPLVIIAGAGSGKTRLLIERIALLVAAKQSGSLAPGTILVLTFTRTAAREVLDRLHARLAAQDLEEVDVRTFHSYGLALLRSGWAREYLALDRVRVATRGQVLQAAADALAQAGLDVPPWAAPGIIGETKLGRPPRIYDADRVRAALQAYNTWLRRHNLIDVHDMVLLPVEILRHHERARADIQHRVAHVIADESQDWHAYQAALIAYAAGPSGHFTVVGDPMQSIFSGSSPRYLLECSEVFRQVQSVTLTRSYRLHGALLALANAIGAHLARGIMVHEPMQPDGPLPTVHIAPSTDDEAAWIAHEVQGLLSSGAVRRARHVAILTRTRAQRDRLTQALRAAGLPTRSGATTFADKPTVSAIMAWLALVRDGSDSAALLRAIAAPPRGRQRAAPRSLHAALAVGGPWTMERLARECPLGLSNGQTRALAQFIRLYAGLVQLSAEDEPTVTFDAVLERTGLREWLTVTDDDAREDIARLRDLAAQERDVGALQHLLGGERIAADRAAVLVSTVHAFKGREAEAVFVAGLDEGWFPHRVVLEDGPEGLEEEIRAFYVAVTRARRWLYLSAACEPVSGLQTGCPSRFLRPAFLPPNFYLTA